MPRRAVGVRANPLEQIIAHHVVDVIQVRQAITGQIDEQATGRPTGRVPGDLCRNICKSPISIIMKEAIKTDVGNIEIGEPVTVIIAHGDTLAIARLNDVGLRRDIHELLSVLIAKKAVEEFSLGCGSRPATALSPIAVGPTIVIQVEHGGSAAGEFEHPFAFAGWTAIGKVAEIESNLCCFVGESDRRCGSVRWAGLNLFGRLVLRCRHIPVGARQARQVQIADGIHRVDCQRWKRRKLRINPLGQVVCPDSTRVAFQRNPAPAPRFPKSSKFQHPFRDCSNRFHIFMF